MLSAHVYGKINELLWEMSTASCCECVQTFAHWQNSVPWCNVWRCCDGSRPDSNVPPPPVRCFAVCHRVTWGRSWSWKVFCPSPVWIKKILPKLRRNLRRFEVFWSSFLSTSWVSRTFCHPLVLKRPWSPWRCGPETQRRFLLWELCHVTVLICVLTLWESSFRSNTMQLELEQQQTQGEAGFNFLSIFTHSKWLCCTALWLQCVKYQVPNVWSFISRTLGVTSLCLSVWHLI